MLPKKDEYKSLFEDVKTIQKDLMAIQKQLQSFSKVSVKLPKTVPREAKLIETDRLSDAAFENANAIKTAQHLQKIISAKGVKTVQAKRSLSSYAMSYAKMAPPILETKKDQYQELCQLMRSMVETTGALQSYIMELNKHTPSRLAAMYAALSQQNPDAFASLSKDELIKRIKDKVTPIREQLLISIDKLQDHYIDLRQELDPQYKITVETGKKIKHALENISEELKAVVTICRDNKSPLAGTLDELNQKLQEILLMNTLDQDKFKKILGTASLLLEQAKLALHKEFNDPPLLARINSHLSNVSTILNGSLSEDLLSFRKTLMGSVAKSAVEFCLPLVTGALNALVPFHLPTHLSKSIESGILSVGDSIIDKAVEKTTKEKHKNLQVLDKEWEKLWYIEAVKNVDFVGKGLTYVAVLGSSALLSALGAPHLAALLVSAGISASGSIIPRAMEKINIQAEEQKAFNKSLSQLANIQEKLQGNEARPTQDPVLKLVQDFLQLDEKHLLAFQIEALKLDKITDYYEISGVTSIETMERMDRMKSDIKSESPLEAWALLKIYHDATLLQQAKNPDETKSLQQELRKSIEDAMKHVKKNYGDYNPNVLEKFIGVLDRCYEITTEATPGTRLKKK